MMASRVSGSPTCALAATTRKVLLRASSRPPPSAREAMALMLGTGRAESAARVARRVARKARVLGEGEHGGFGGRRRERGH